MFPWDILWAGHWTRSPLHPAGQLPLTGILQTGANSWVSILGPAPASGPMGELKPRGPGHVVGLRDESVWESWSPRFSSIRKPMKRAPASPLVSRAWEHSPQHEHKVSEAFRRQGVSQA